MNSQKLSRLAFALLLNLLVASGAAWSAANRQPNIVFIFIDDMGYGDIGPFGSTVNQTPELDRMAEEGMTLTQYYVSATACTPSNCPRPPPFSPQCVM